MVGVHACPSWKEQVRYEELWTNNAQVRHRKTTRSSMKKYKHTLAYQYDLSGSFLVKLNKKKKSGFNRFLRKECSP